MKLTVNSAAPVEMKATFNHGDFFVTNSGHIRQLLRNNDGDYGIYDPKNFSLATGISSLTAQKAVERYVESNGSITKLEVQELIFNKTNKVLTREMLEDE